MMKITIDGQVFEADGEITLTPADATNAPPPSDGGDGPPAPDGDGPDPGSQDSPSADGGDDQSDEGSLQGAGLSLALDRATVGVGDTFEIIATMTDAHGNTTTTDIPDRFAGYDRAIIAPVGGYNWTRKYQALKQGSTRIKNSSGGKTAWLTITVGPPGSGSTPYGTPQKDDTDDPGSGADSGSEAADDNASGDSSSPGGSAAPAAMQIRQIGAGGEPVTLQASIGDEQIRLSARPGERVRAKNASGNLTKVTVRHFGDGGACIENWLAGNGGDAKGHFTLTQGASNVLFDGDLCIYNHTRTHPFWYQQPQIKADWDRNKVPRYVDAPSAGFYAWVSGADNGPMGASAWYPKMGAPGERKDLGPLDGFGAAYVTNPSKKNAQVVRWMADAASVWSFGNIDEQTLDIIKPEDHPNVSMLSRYVGKGDNPIKHGSNSPLVMSQAAAHAPAFCVLASLIYGTEYDMETMCMWASHIGRLWQNPGYCISDGAGPNKFPAGQTRGLAWSLQQMVQAAVIDPVRGDYYKRWVNQFLDSALDHFGDQSGLWMDRSGNYYNRHGMAPWQLDFWVSELGFARRMGFAQAATLIQHFGLFQVSRVLDLPVELATLYSVRVTDDNNHYYPDWPTMVRETAKTSAKYTNALAQKTNTQAMRDAMFAGNDNYRVGDLSGFPWSPTGYPAMLRIALAECVDAKVPRADKAWQLFAARDRSDYSQDPKYGVLPRAA